MDYLLNDDKSDNDLARKIFIFSNPGFSCYHARLRAGIFKFSNAPQAVFPVQKKEALIQALLFTTLGHKTGAVALQIYLQMRQPSKNLNYPQNQFLSSYFLILFLNYSFQVTVRNTAF